MNNENKYRKEFKKGIEFLNKKQREAVELIEGPVAVVAGPGTGKTQILTLRIANIMDKMGADMAENILALTFTNAGVYAMRDRLSDFVGTELAYKTGIFTFHSFAETQIKENPEIFTQFTFSRPITDIEKIQIIEKILNSKEWEHLQTFASKFHYTKKIISAIDNLKSEAVSPNDLEISILSLEKRILEEEGEDAFYKVNRGDFKKGDIKKTVLDKIERQKNKQEDLVEIYREYQNQLLEKSLYDFSDTILSVVKEAEENKNFREIIQEKYLYILVDEHQDTNSAQNKMIELIGSAEVNENKPNIFTVGDQKQAIYRFQGASIEEFEKFRTQYKDVKIITLESNYRSSQNILNAANALIEEKKPLVAENLNIKKEKRKVLINQFSDYKSELISLAENIKSEIDSGTDVNEIAIFYKENKNLGEIKSILSKFKIPYKVKSKENILDSIEVKKLLLLLRATMNMTDDEVLAKTLFIDFLDFDAYDILKILEKLSKRKGEQIKNKSIFKIIKSENILKDLEVSDVKKYLDFSKFLEKQKKLSYEIDFLDFFSQFIEDSGFLKYILKSKTNVTSMAVLDKIFNQIKEQSQIKNNYSLKDFLEYVDILKKYEISIALGVNDLTDGVNLMTAHGSKGLEFQSVYITNVIDTKWGGSKKRARDFTLPIKKHFGDIDDERRLFYVALTRGKKIVNISYSQFDINMKELKPSRFLEEIGDEFFEYNKINQKELSEKLKIFFSKEEEKVLSIFDKEYIRKLFLKNTLSISAFNNYKQSPIKYFFRNLVRLPSSQNESLIFGNVIHDTLDVFFKKMKKEKKILDKKILLAEFEDSLKKFYIPEIYFEKIKKHGEEVLNKYWDEYHNDFIFDVDTEKRIFAEFNLKSGEKLKLYGIIDKMEKIDGGKIRVVDYKTGKTFSDKNKEQKKDLERQLVFYKLLIDKYYNQNRVEEGVLDFVEISKKKNLYVKEKRFIGQKEVQDLEEEINEFAEDILSGNFLDKKYTKDKDNEEFFELWELLKKGGE